MLSLHLTLCSICLIINSEYSKLSLVTFAVTFDTIGSSIDVTKNQDNTYIIEFVGKDQFSLPMKLYYNGFLAIDITD